MLVYEVSIEVETPLRAVYLAWLREHVAEILALPGFTGAEILEVIDPPSVDGWFGVCVQYRLTDAAALDTYLREHAPRLRANGIERFGERMRARRRVLHALA